MAVIKKEGGKVILYTADGKRRIGEHKSKASAIRQEIAIKYAQAREKGKKKPS